MEDVDFTALIKHVGKSTKNSYETYQRDGKDIPNVANLGGKIGDIAKLERHGEYHGIAIELLQDLKPLLTEKFVIRILTMLKNEDYITPLALLGLTSMDQLQYILHKWMQLATVDYDNSLAIKKTFPVFDDWINTVTHDPILGRIKVVEIGHNENTGDSVVPIEWIGREFESGYEMHKAMDKIESRIGKPPVTYCIIYSMIIQKNDSLVTNIESVKFDKIFYLDWLGVNFDVIMTTKPRNNYQYVVYDKILIGFKLDDILEPKGKISGEHDQTKLREVGVLVSRLQKSIRRGRYGSKALIETIDSLNISPNYNLPEHAFMRVSASKQMVWRLFITILEDCRPYTPIYEPSLLHLLLLVLITQKVQEYKFTKPVLQAIKLTAVLAQYNDSVDDLYDWRSEPIAGKTPLVKDSNFHTAISLALDNLIMMAGDNRMLRHYYSVKTAFKPFVYPPQLNTKKWPTVLSASKYILHNEKIYRDVVLASIDMHNKTNIILYYQACIAVSLTTKQISNYIWDISSGYNIRSGEAKPPTDKLLRSIQTYFYEHKDKAIHPNTMPKPIIPSAYIDIKPSTFVKRTSFLILFATKYRYHGKEVILAGTRQMPARVKLDNEWTYRDDLDIINAYPKKTISVTDIDPPIGYKWSKNKFDTEIINGVPYIDNKKTPYFDASAVLVPTVPKITKFIHKKVYRQIIQIFSGLDIDFADLLYFRSRHLKEIFNWLPKKSDMKLLNMELVALAYTKIFNQFNNIIMIGPTDRNGKKMQNSINYLLEGHLWRIFNLFTYMYPDTFKPNGGVNFMIKKDTSGYVHLIDTLTAILFDNKLIAGPVPTIKTELWDHQKDSVNRIVTRFKNGGHGSADSSDVGSGKTLTSLKIATELIAMNTHTYSGILVMLPGNKLIKTWEDELEKHTTGFDIIYQQNNTDIGPIKRNTIVVTTMSRMRDHFINHKWLLIVVDECLTVQNKNALWTESCWRASLMSKHIILMSATFFRTRFDKLYYMLKMLQTGLPERREYLETILLESIVSQVSSIKWKWTSNFNYFELDAQSRQQYDAIERSNMSTEVKFAKLTSFLVSNAKANDAVIKQLAVLIKRMEKKNNRCLIYARANEEAEFWSSGLGIPIYPKKGNHCIVTVHNGAYGLNDLVIYNCLVLRPVQPDLIPQIKGRLARYNQKSTELFIEYFVMKDTIEEGLILRLNICSQFIQKYIMPLSTFYDISVNYKKYLEEQENK